MGGVAKKLWRLAVRSEFSAAHALRGCRGKCEALHGHNFSVELVVEGGSLQEGAELLVDFAVLKARLRRLEKEAIGFLLTSHPLQQYWRDRERLGHTPLEEARELPPGAEIRSAVLVTQLKEVFTKSRGERMAFVNAEDFSARAEIIFFPDSYLEARSLLGSEEALEITARVDSRSAASGQEEDEEEGPREIKLSGQSVRLLSEACAACDMPVRIEIPDTHLDAEHMRSLARVLSHHPGSVEVQADVRVDAHLCTLRFAPRYRVQPGPALERELQKWVE
jgi:DNA polymerase-3 subunit alpha